MATITINIPDAVAPRVLDAIAVRYEWDVNSGLTKAQFAKDVIIALLKDTVRIHEANTAAQQASDLATTAVDVDILLT